jgi:hypothetical protein
MVEVEYDGVRGIVDPHFGIIYRHADGRAATLKDLIADPDLARANCRNAVRMIRVAGEPVVAAPYPVDLDGYNFKNAAYANFKYFGPFRFRVHAALTRWFGPDGPLIPFKPVWMIFPAYTLAAMIDTAFVAVLLLRLAGSRIGRRLRRRIDLNAAQQSTSIIPSAC